MPDPETFKATSALGELPPVFDPDSFSIEQISRLASTPCDQEDPWNGMFDPQPPSMDCWSLIAVQAITENGWDIFVLRPNVTNILRLTDHPAADVNPSLNSLATEVAFTSFRDGNANIYKVPTDGSAPPIQLTNHPADDQWASWSPDGTHLVYASMRDGKWDIYRMTADGVTQQRMTADDANNIMPAWSSDGTQIAWAKRYGQAGELWVMNADGTNPRQLTQQLPYMQYPKWSAGSRYILFSASTDNDPWNELALYDMAAADQPLRTYYDARQDWHDMWGAALQPRGQVYAPDGDATLATRVVYRIEGNTIYLDDIRIEKLSFGIEMGFAPPPVVVSRAAYVDHRISDHTPPVTRVAPLPPYSYFVWTEWGEDYTSLAYTAEDRGGSKVKSIDFQYRIENGPWVDWVTVFPKTFPVLNGSHTGKHVAFRTRARDWADNLEAWPEEPEAETRFYAGVLSGQVVDILGYPIPEATISAPSLWPQSQQAGLSGQFQAYLPDLEPRYVQASHPGYTAAEEQISADWYYTMPNVQIALPPVGNLLNDGGFETGTLSEWEPSVDADVSITQIEKHRGNYSLRLAMSPQVQPAQENSVSKQIPIPLAFHKPLLSFYALHSSDFYDVSPNHLFAVAIETSTETSKPLSTQLPVTGWTFHTLDLTPWRGQTITLTLSLTDLDLQDQNSHQVYLDDVAISRWETPVITGIEPNPVELTNGKKITITGQNFIKGATLHLGMEQLPNVVYVDERHMEVTLTENLPPQILPLWVTNPGGARAVRYFAIGLQSYLPVVSR